MTRLIAALQTEPVRVWLYGIVVVAVLPGLLLAGVITGAWVALGTTAAGVVLVVGPAAELVRASVYPPAALRAAGVLPDRGPQHAPDGVDDVTVADLAGRVGGVQ